MSPTPRIGGSYGAGGGRPPVWGRRSASKLPLVDLERSWTTPRQPNPPGLVKRTPTATSDASTPLGRKACWGGVTVWAGLRYQSLMEEK